MKKWMCDACGQMTEGENAPGTCARCKGSKFILQEETKDLSNVSVFSKEIHGIMKVDSLLNQVLDTVDKGIQANTCASCTPLYEKIKADTNTLKQMIKAELKSHITKGNWG